MLEHLQWAAFGLAMIRPRFAANANPFVGPDDTPPASALEVPRTLEEELRGYVCAGGPSVASPKPRASHNKHTAKVYQFPRVANGHRKRIPDTKLAMGFAHWMVKNGHTEPLLSHEVDDYVELYCDAISVRLPDFTEARIQIASIAGVDYGRRRIRAPKYDELRERTDVLKPSVYEFTKRIPALNAHQFDALDRLSRCGTVCGPTGQGRGGQTPGRRGRKATKRTKKQKNQDLTIGYAMPEAA